MLHSLVLVLFFSLTFAHTGVEYSDFLKWSVANNIYEEDLVQYYPVWRENVEYIMKHNSKDTGYTLEINKFAHLTPDKLPKFGTFRAASSLNKPLNHYFDPPPEVDWRSKGVVTSVRNQGNTGCSVEIFFADVVSSFHAVETGHLVEYSVQQLIDCCTKDCNCEDTLLEPGRLAYCIKKHGGLCSDYPDHSNTSECECLKCKGDKFVIQGVREVHSGNETALEYAVAMQPVMAGIDAGQKSFQLYHEGVYSDPLCSNTTLDHVLLVVGYGKYQDQDFWLCKNSWGSNWGMNGYIMVARNHDNTCGIATAAYYPY